MSISEVRKCSRSLDPVNSLIDQLHHCVVGTYMLISNVIQICYLNFSTETNPQKYVDSERVKC